MKAQQNYLDKIRREQYNAEQYEDDYNAKDKRAA